LKIEQVRKLKNDLIRAKKLTMKVKLERAEEKRVYLLQMKAKKAADEEQKAHEILFINNLKEQNRKQDILERYEKKHEVIRHNLEEERVRKQEELKAKEAAAVVWNDLTRTYCSFNIATNWCCFVKVTPKRA
jgi:hypothetical protein